MLSFDLQSRGVQSDVRSDVQSEVRRLLSLVLLRPIGEAENPSRDSEPAWDSLKHVEIVFLMEDHFKVRFDGSEISRLQSAGELVRLLEARLAPQP